VISTLPALPTARAAGATTDGGWVVAGNSRARLHWCPKANDQTAAASPVAFFELQLDPGWKTYWRMPGDAGVPPSFEWTEGSNVSSAVVYYPAPHRMADQGGEAVGYKTAVIFPIRLALRDPKLEVAPVVIANLGICKNICVPVEVKLTGDCYGASAETAAALETVPRAPGQARADDPKLVSVTGSVKETPAKLIIDVDFGKNVTETDVLIEAPEGYFVPLPIRASPDANGRAKFVVDLTKSIDVKDLFGKELRLTMLSSKGAAEALWTAK
jgi:DsbC/DsbD-like thiol-disulfide interchange protein